MKSSKAEAEYVHDSILSDQCSGCTMFRGQHGCTKVEGEKSQNGWCKYFEPKYRKVAEALHA